MFSLCTALKMWWFHSAEHQKDQKTLLKCNCHFDQKAVLETMEISGCFWQLRFFLLLAVVLILRENKITWPCWVQTLWLGFGWEIKSDQAFPFFSKYTHLESWLHSADLWSWSLFFFFLPLIASYFIHCKFSSFLNNSWNGCCFLLWVEEMIWWLGP